MSDLISEVSEADSKVLAAQVVVYRTLGMNRELAKACMQELAKRRKEGEEFDYETFIEEKVAAMPKMKNMDLMKVTQDIQKQIRSMNGGTVIQPNNKKNSG